MDISIETSMTSPKVFSTAKNYTKTYKKRKKEDYESMKIKKLGQKYLYFQLQN